MTPVTESSGQFQNIPFANWRANAFKIFLLTASALLIHGYHPFSEDAEIYLPGVEKILHPALFPEGQPFFASHAHLTLFPNLVAASLRVTHLPFEVGLLVWHVASVFLFLVALWQLAGVLFSSERARWGAVALVTALLTIPVAGTALYILDQYLNPRNLAAFAAVFAVTRTLEKKYLQALLWLVFAAVVHPLMSAFAFSLCFLLIAMDWLPGLANGLPATASCFAPFGISLAPQASQAYREAAKYHGFHYVQRWEWYEILGAVAPVALLWWFGRIAQRQQRAILAKLCRALVIYNVVYLAAALVVDFPARFEALARLQPLRSLHLLYILMFVVMGGLLGEYVLKNYLWRWLLLFIPLCAGMFAAQRALFPASAHLELPGMAPRNDWAKAFRWIEANTPTDAVFAIDPQYMRIAGEDSIGFRCLARRSRLADAVKDSGAVSMFPPLAETWWAEMQAQDGWKHFSPSDWVQLRANHGVRWVVLETAQRASTTALDCPYGNEVVQVCRLP